MYNFFLFTFISTSLVITILNYAPAIKINNFERLFALVDLLVVNEVELAQLIEFTNDSNEPQMESTVLLVEKAKSACMKFLEKYAINLGIIVTLGEQGVVFTSNKQNRVGKHFVCPKANVVDTSVGFYQII
jgi:sugar/nucleoside kinase (ribokinase family)